MYRLQVWGEALTPVTAMSIELLSSEYTTTAVAHHQIQLPMLRPLGYPSLSPPSPANKYEKMLRSMILEEHTCPFASFRVIGLKIKETM